MALAKRSRRCARCDWEEAGLTISPVLDSAGRRRSRAALPAEGAASAMDTPGFRSAVLADPQGAVFSIGRLTADP